MKPPVPLPETPPFLTFYTPTYRRPAALTRCLRSLSVQTARDRIEHLVVPDHVGYGLVNGLFGRLPWYAEACRGRYVHLLADDDYLPTERLVEHLEAFVAREGEPEVIVAQVQKGSLVLPLDPPGTPPVSGRVDLASYILRRDIWLRHVRDYGQRYEGDFDHATVLWQAGYRHVYFPELWVVGGQGHGRPEVDWP